MKTSKFKVTGYAFIPIEVSMEVDAVGPEDAKRKAVILFENSEKKSQFIVTGTEDECAVFDWLPSLAHVSK